MHKPNGGNGHVSKLKTTHQQQSGWEPIPKHHTHYNVLQQCSPAQFHRGHSIFPAKLNKALFFPLQGHEVPTSQVHIQKLTRTQGSCNNQIYSETKPLSDVPIEPITSTCPVLSFKKATTGGLFKGLGWSKSTICLIKLWFSIPVSYFSPHTAPFPQSTRLAWMIYRNSWFGLGLWWPHTFWGPGCFLSIFILKDEQTHRMEKNNKERKQKQSRRSKRQHFICKKLHP